MAAVVWSGQAKKELDDCAEYIDRDSPFYAAQFVDSILEKTKQLEIYPDSGRIVPEIGDLTIRELIHGNYRIIYKYFASENCCQILSIYHSARLFPRP